MIDKSSFKLLDATFDPPLTLYEQKISDTPAWIVPKANQYVKGHGKIPFSIYQGKSSVLERSFERDIIPMARAEGLALAPWDVLGGGKIRSDAEEARRRENGEKGRKGSRCGEYYFRCVISHNA